MKIKKLLTLRALLTCICIIAVPYPAAIAETTDEPRTESRIAGWSELTTTLETLPEEILTRLPPDMANDPQVQQEVARLILQSLTLSSLIALGADGDNPIFLPSIGELMNVGQPNADTLYKTAQITPGGSYRLRGKKGSLNMAVIGQVGPMPAEPGSDGDHPGATRNYLELGSLTADEEGNFDVLLSQKRPEGYAGDWWELNPKTYRLMLRQVSVDWAREVDPSIAIERIDVPAGRRRPGADSMAARLQRLPGAVNFMATMFVDRAVKLEREGYVNRLKAVDLSQSGGLDGQFYYEGAYRLAGDEALIIEAMHPARCEYRSILLTNEIYQTTDWHNNHSSLNSAQAAVDDDGILRIVVSARDPGVSNWLDTAGYPFGVVQGRWTNCDSRPVPTVNKVPVEQVMAHLPATTATVTAAQRDAIIRTRRAAYQQRRHW